jgi:outer membrane protein
MTVLTMLDRTARFLALTLWFLPAMALAQSGARVPGADPQAAAGAGTMRLSLKDAFGIALAPEGSVRVQLAGELVRQASARSAEARSLLLPNLSASVSSQNETRNLEAVGIVLSLPIPGYSFPRMVGPFDVLDARVMASQTILNMGSIRRYQASRAGMSQAEAEKQSAEEEVMAQVARAYLSALRADVYLAAVQADVQFAEAILKQAQNQKAAGTGIGIEVTRAGVQLANQQQRLLVARNQRTAAQLLLLRAIHLHLDTRLILTDQLTHVAAAAPDVPQALQEAYAARADWQAQQKRLETARLQQSAARMDRMPSVSFFADYGASGSGVDHSLPTRAYGVAVQIPIFDGGRVDARRAQGISQYHQEMIRSEDLRAQIELEVRLALDSMQSSAEQVKTAEEGLSLAENEGIQAERRYRTGVGTSLEVVDAQTRLERARENRVEALYNQNIARINLAAATGTMRQIVR